VSSCQPGRADQSLAIQRPRPVGRVGPSGVATVGAGVVGGAVTTGGSTGGAGARGAGPVAQPASQVASSSALLPRIAARRGAPATVNGKGLGLIVLEALVALVIVVLFGGWTMFSGRRRDDRDRREEDDRP
jgi:hypothetical protein